MATFLPEHYPSSVAPGYVGYVRWQAVSYVAASANGVLSMQALLFAIGLGADAAVPMAAALNWVLKDGLGQLGGILFASLVSRQFDAESKRWRLLAAVALDASILLEVLTPLVPALFLPMASAANVGKNVSWLAASASRAGIHASLAVSDNLADVTAKTGSQTIAASLLGTGVGIALSPLLGPSTSAVLPAALVFSAAHIWANVLAVRHVSLPTLSATRAEHVLYTWLTAHRTPLPDEVAGREALLLPSKPAFGRSIRVGAPLQAIVPDAHTLDALWAASVGRGVASFELEGTVAPGDAPPWHTAAGEEEEEEGDGTERSATEPATVVASAVEALAAANGGERPLQACVVFAEGAPPEDDLRAFAAGCALQHLVTAPSGEEAAALVLGRAGEGAGPAVEECRRAVTSGSLRGAAVALSRLSWLAADELDCAELRSAGWHLDALFVEPKGALSRVGPGAPPPKG